MYNEAGFGKSLKSYPEMILGYGRRPIYAFKKCYHSLMT